MSTNYYTHLFIQHSDTLKQDKVKVLVFLFFSETHRYITHLHRPAHDYSTIWIPLTYSTFFLRWIIVNNFFMYILWSTIESLLNKNYPNYSLRDTARFIEKSENLEQTLTKTVDAWPIWNRLFHMPISI